MGTRRLVTAATPHALEQRVCAEVVRLQAGDPLRPVVVVVPSNAVATRLRYALHSVHRVRAGVRLATMRDIASHLAERALRAAGAAPLEPPADGLLLEDVAVPLAAEPGRPFAAGARQPGFVLALAETFKDLGEAGGTGHFGLSPALPPAGDAATEVGRLWAAWRAALDARGLYDTVRLLEAACATPVRLPDGATDLLCYGFYDLTGLQRRLLLHLAEHASVTPFVPVAGNATAGRYGEEARAWFASHSFAHDAAASAGPRDDDTDLARLQRGCFAAAPTDPRKEADATVIFADVPGGEHEAREVARQLLAWRRERIPWRDMAVLYHGGGETGRTLTRVLAGIGVPLEGLEPAMGRLPLRTDEDPALDSTAPGRALLALLALRGSDWARGDVIDALGLAPLRDCDGPAPTSRWESLAREAGVVAGLAQWGERLERHACECERRAADAEREDQPGRAAGLRRAASDARRCVEVVSRVAERLDALPAGGSPDALVDATLAVLDATLGGEDGAPDTDAEIVEVREAVQWCRRAGAVVGHLSWDRWARLLADTLAGTRLRRTRRRPDGVFVGSLYAARGLPFQAVAIVGLTERRFPPPVREDPLLSDRARKLWRDADPDGALDLAARRPDEERLLFSLALASAGARLYCSVPRVDPADGRALVPSLFALAALEAVAGRPARAIDANWPWVRRVPLGALSEARRFEALDPAEFDGSVVQAALLARDRAMLGALAEPDGAAPLRRALAAADARFGEHALTPHDGVLCDPEGIAAVRRRADDAGARSPSRLETYARCPYRYFLQYELGIEAVDEPDETERISALDRGTLVHAILEELVGAVADRLPLDAEDEAGMAALCAAADPIVDRRFAGFEARGLTGAPVIGAADRERIRTAVHAYVRSTVAGDDFVPVGQEVRFGFPATRPGEAGVDAPVVVTLPGGRRVAFRGYMDRVDRSPDGAQLRVVDYKTGKPPDPRRVARGEALQLPVYALAAEQAFPGAVVASAEYHAVHHDPRAAGVVGLRGADLAAAREALLQVATTVDDGIRAGRFFATPSDDGCRWCDFRPVCGPGRFILWDRKRDDDVAAEVRRLQDGPEAGAEAGEADA